jgi:hypothetical protein
MLDDNQLGDRLRRAFELEAPPATSQEQPQELSHAAASRRLQSVLPSRKKVGGGHTASRFDEPQASRSRGRPKDRSMLLS